MENTESRAGNRTATVQWGRVGALFVIIAHALAATVFALFGDAFRDTPSHALYAVLFAKVIAAGLYTLVIGAIYLSMNAVSKAKARTLLRWMAGPPLAAIGLFACLADHVSAAEGITVALSGVAIFLGPMIANRSRPTEETDPA